YCPVCFYCYVAHRDLHSFPTRRSSDLVVRKGTQRVVDIHERGRRGHAAAQLEHVDREVSALDDRELLTTMRRIGVIVRAVGVIEAPAADRERLLAERKRRGNGERGCKGGPRRARRGTGPDPAVDSCHGPPSR